MTTLRNKLIKHQIFIQRLGGTEAKKIEGFLDRLKNTAKLEAAIGLTGQDLKRELRKSMAGLSQMASDELLKLAEYESEFSAKLFSKSFKKEVVPASTAKLEKALHNNNMEINNLTREGTRKSITAAYDQFGRRKADEIAQVIMDAKANGLGTTDTFKKIDERIRGLHKTQARALAMTAVNYTTNLARNEVVLANPELNKVIWVSVLDNGTTDYCEDHDGTIYDADDGPRPPAHWGCRSHVEPYVE